MDAKGLKVLLLETGQRTEDEWPPLGLGYIAAFLKKHLQNINVKIVVERQRGYIDEFQPDIVGISSVSQDYSHAKSLAKFCKDKGIAVIVGGPHISSLPKTLTPYMDVGVLGQGEEIALELVCIFLKNRCFPPEQLCNIKGTIYRDASGNVVHTEQPSLPVDMDYIPFPERICMPKNRMMHLLTSRGCKYRCSFCTPAILTKYVRFFSAEYVMDEIKHYISIYNAKDFFVFDDQFIENVERIEKMIKIVERDNLSFKINLIVNARANLINKKILLLLKRLGVKKIAFGLESMSPRILRYLKGPSANVEDNIRAVELSRRLGFEVIANIIVGSPDETEKEMLESINFLLRKRIFDSYVYILTPLPGTPVWQYAKSRKLVSEDESMDWEKISFPREAPFIYKHNFGKNVVLSEVLTRSELYRLYKYYLKRKKILFFMERAKRFLKKYIRRLITDKLDASIKLYLNKKKLLLKIHKLLNKMGLTEKNDIVKLINSGIAPLPQILEFEVTNRCNLNCKMCFFKNKALCTNELKTCEIKSFIKKLPDSIKCAFLTGGEPFLREDIIQILTYLDEAGISSTVLTNGTILTEQIADGLVNLKYLNGVTISLDSLGPSHNSIRGKEGTFEAVMDTIQRLKRRNVNIDIVTVLLKDNLDDIEKMAAYAKKNKLNYFIQPENIFLLEDALKTAHILNLKGENADTILRQKGKSSLSEVPVAKIKRTIRNIRSMGIGSSTGSKAFWYLPEEYLCDTIRSSGVEFMCLDYDTLHVDPCGNIIGCMAIRKPFGNILKDDIVDLWNSAEYKNFRLTLIKNNLLPICSQCCKMDIFL